MKLARWLVVSLLALSALGVLGAGTWWWVTWPERTAREFHELIRTRRFGEAVRMLGTPVTQPDTRLAYLNVAMKHKPRELSDMILGSLQFQLVYAANDSLDWREYYVVRRGKVFFANDISEFPNH